MLPHNLGLGVRKHRDVSAPKPSGALSAIQLSYSNIIDPLEATQQFPSERPFEEAAILRADNAESVVIGPALDKKRRAREPVCHIGRQTENGDCRDAKDLCA